MPTDFRAIAKQKAEKYGLLPDVFLRQIQQESGFNPGAVSEAGALGIAQIMPSTARGWGVNPRDPVASLDAAARNMAAYIKTYGGKSSNDPVKVRSAYEKALQAYNAGPGSVGRYLPNETKNYISKIIGPDKFSFTEALGAKAPPVVDTDAVSVGPPPPPPLPRFDFKGALDNIIKTFAVKRISQAAPEDTTSQYLALANQLETSDSEDALAAADELRNKALAAAGNSVESSSSGAEELVQKLFQAKMQEAVYNQQVAKAEQAVNAAPAQSVSPTGGKGIAIPGVVITSATDASGEPGFDFVIPGGRGAEFKLPFQAQVLKVVGDQNWETNLEKGPGKRGYGNHVEIRGVDPKTGKQFDVLLAHFDKLNPGLKPGSVIGAGTVIGTQGRTGSTTGAHVSADFYDPGKNSTSSETMSIGYQIRDRLAKGQAVF
jgi:soluble lytic murein transglycosylase-like protein